MQTDRGIYHKRVCDHCGAVLGGRMMNPDEYFKDWAWRRDTGDLLGRRSYMPSLVCGYIISFLPELTDETLDCFERDIAKRKRTGFDFGDSCDYETWDAFYKAVCKEIERRKNNADI